MPVPVKTTDPEKLIPAVVSAAIGATSFQGATRTLGQRQQESLSVALRMPVDQWRARFAEELRATGEELLAITRRDLEKIKPDARAYTLAVLIDKANALEGRVATQNAQVNIQVNNYGATTSKADLLRQLDGDMDGVETALSQEEAKTSPETDHANQPETQTKVS